MVPQQLEQKYNSILPFLVELKKQVGETLSAFADENNFPSSGRIKKREAVGEKIEMGRYKCFSEIDDLVAFTVIVPSAAYESAVVEFCRQKFRVLDVRSKSTANKPPESFRFDSTRVIAQAQRRQDVDSKVPSIFDLKFEIQVRTAFEHAWAVSTHDLVYKGASIDWKRVRLAAQLKATSEGLDAAVASFDHLAKAITESPWMQVKERSEMSDFVTTLFEQHRLPTELKPGSISRFSENICSLVGKIRPKLKVTEAITVLNTELPEIASTPMSLSLYQLFLGVLSQRDGFEGVQEISCHVTPELMTIYPETRAIKSVFNYDK